MNVSVITLQNLNCLWLKNENRFMTVTVRTAQSNLLSVSKPVIFHGNRRFYFWCIAEMSQRAAQRPNIPLRVKETLFRK